MLAAVASWMTPASLFVLLNLVIGTIAVSSRFASSRHQHQQPGPNHSSPPLARAPSLMDRVRSINFPFHKFPEPNSDQEEVTRFYQSDEPGYDTNRFEPQPPRLARAPSLMDRVKSINFTGFKFPNPYLEQQQEEEAPRFHQQSEPVHEENRVEPYPPKLARDPSLLDRVKSINFSGFKYPNHYSEQEEGTQSHQTSDPVYNSDQVDPEPPKLVCAPSLLERVKSINFSGFKYPNHYSEQEEGTQSHQTSDPVYNSDQVDPEPPKLIRASSLLERVKYFTSVYNSQQQYQKTENEMFENFETESEVYKNNGTVPGQKPKRSQSETKKPKAKVKDNVKKSASEKSMKVETENELADMVERRRPQTARLEKRVSIGDGDLSVDAKADDFINRFKKQLKLQRLNSLLRQKEMPNPN